MYYLIGLIKVFLIFIFFVFLQTESHAQIVNIEKARHRDSKVGFNGEVSTKNEVPTFAMKLGMDQLQIAETFKSLELFKVLAPIAQVLKGKFSSDIVLSGNLTDDFTPDLLSLSGDILANLMAKEISTENAPVLSALDSKLDFINLNELDLKELKTTLSFKDGLVSVKPFTFSYKDVNITVDGNHTFDQKLNYKASMQVPSKYLGKEINALIGYEKFKITY